MEAISLPITLVTVHSLPPSVIVEYAHPVAASSTSAELPDLVFFALPMVNLIKFIEYISVVSEYQCLLNIEIQTIGLLTVFSYYWHMLPLWRPITESVFPVCLHYIYYILLHTTYLHHTNLLLYVLLYYITLMYYPLYEVETLPSSLW